MKSEISEETSELHDIAKLVADKIQSVQVPHNNGDRSPQCPPIVFFLEAYRLRPWTAEELVHITHCPSCQRWTNNASIAGNESECATVVPPVISPSLIRSLVDSSGRESKRRWWRPIVALVVLVLLSSVFFGATALRSNAHEKGYKKGLEKGMESGVAQGEQQTETKYAPLLERKDKEIKQITVENKHLRATEVVDETGSTFQAGGAVRTIWFVTGTMGIPPESKIDEAKVDVDNEHFPCILKWQLADKAGEPIYAKDVPHGQSTHALPSGRLRLTCDPSVTLAWYQPFGIVHNNRYLGSTLGPITIDLKPGDTLRLRMDHPFTPWNATMLQIGDEWAVLTLERAWAKFDVAKFVDGKWSGSEDLPNTALFWARDKSAGLAHELAKEFISHRNDKMFPGKVRGKMHTSIIVVTKDGKLSERLMMISQDELTRHLTTGFEMLRKQRPPVGPSIQEEIDTATSILKTLSPKR